MRYSRTSFYHLNKQFPLMSTKLKHQGESYVDILTLEAHVNEYRKMIACCKGCAGIETYANI